MNNIIKYKISGHRGTRIKAIENTRAAFQYCIDNNIDYIEFDVKKTKDNIPVIFHDRKIDRLLNGKGPIEQFTLKKLRNFNYKDGQKIETLEEFFEQVGKKIKPMLEIKSRNISKQIMELVHKFKYRGDEILIQSFTPKDIVECYNIDSQYDYGLCLGPIGKFPILKRTIAKSIINFYILKYPIKWLNLDGPFIYDEFMQIAHKKGLHFILGANHPEKYLENLEKWNIEIINADDPVYIKNILYNRLEN